MHTNCRDVRHYFYPRSPCGERRYLIVLMGFIMQFLSTLSLRRATAQKRYHGSPAADFYPRSPCGERPYKQIGIQLDFTISIHALLAESDQSRSRKTGRLLPFLSTLSLRRATPLSAMLSSGRGYFYPRSPCGERQPNQRHEWKNRNFYPRSPCGERRNPFQAVFRDGHISIHALLAESDGLSYAL